MRQSANNKSRRDCGYVALSPLTAKCRLGVECGMGV